MSAQAHNIGINTTASRRTKPGIPSAVRPPQRRFEHFFAIPQEHIKRDLAAPLDVDDRQSRCQQSLQDPQRSVQWKEAQGLHEILVYARKIQGDPDVPLEEYIFFADYAARSVASDTIYAAMERGRLKRVCKRIDRIKAREGWVHLPDWANGDGPADYEKAVDDFVRLVMRLEDTVLTTVFQRYGLTLALDLYEHNYYQYSRLYCKGMQQLRKDFPPKAQVNPPVPEMPASAQTHPEQGLRLRNRAPSKLADIDPLDYSI